MVTGSKSLRQTRTITNMVYRETLMVHIYPGDIVEYLHRLKHPSNTQLKEAIVDLRLNIIKAFKCATHQQFIFFNY